MENPNSSNLDNWLQFKNDDVINSFCKSLDIPKQEAVVIFEDMIRFLWLGKNYDDSELRTIDRALFIIDEMWHNFIQFTKEYREFCQEYVGYFVDHCPITNKDIAEFELKTKEENFEENYRIRKRKRYEEIFDIFGEEVFTRWFHDYPERYSPAKICSLRIS